MAVLSWPFVLRSTSDRWEHRAKVAEKHLALLDRRFAEVSTLAVVQAKQIQDARLEYVELAVAQMKLNHPR